MNMSSQRTNVMTKSGVEGVSVPVMIKCFLLLQEMLYSYLSVSLTFRISLFTLFYLYLCNMEKEGLCETVGR